MKTTRQIKEGIKLVIVKKTSSTSVMLYVDESPIRLCKVEKTDNFFWVDYACNENYLVIYSRGCMANQIPLTIEAVYDMTSKKVIPVTKKNKVIFEYMCIAKKGIYTPIVLEFLNENHLGAAEEWEVEDFIRYITAGNVSITKEEIRDYILTAYPCLKEYLNLENPLSLKAYRKILDELNMDIFRFHIMPNALKDEYLSEGE